MAELKPCPFCGGEAKVSCGSNYCEVYCIKCFGRVEQNGIDEAIEAWERRVENEELLFTRQFIVEHGLLYKLLDAWEERNE